MKILLIGGTGTISSAVSREILKNGDTLYLLNRGNRPVPEGAISIIGDISNEEDVREKLSGLSFDCVCDFIAYTRPQVERDYRLFSGRTVQYVFISTASAYAKPSRSYIITEGTTLSNPYWDYSRKKIECEEYLLEKYRSEGFPVTIVRPSHTYCERSVPVGLHGRKGNFQIIKRMLEGKPVIVHGDGSSLWTMTWNEDFARGFVGLLGNAHAIGEAFQITSDESLTWNQIYETIARNLGVEYKPYYVSSTFLISVAPEGYDIHGGLLGDKAVSVVFDNTKLKRAVPSFKACVNFDEGVRRALKYIFAHPECQGLDPEFDEWCDAVIEVQEKARKEFLEKRK